VTLSERIKCAGFTQPGAGKDVSEDVFRFSKRMGFFMLADGMGGQKLGKIAATSATDTASEFIAQSQKDPEGTLPFLSKSGLTRNGNVAWMAMQLANESVMREAGKIEATGQIGASMVLACIDTHSLSFAWTGSARLYRVRGGIIDLLTRDQTFAARRGHAGNWGQNIPLSFLGFELEPKIEVKERPVKSGDAFVMTSGGINDTLTDHEILKIVLESISSRRSLFEISLSLVGRSMELGTVQDSSAFMFMVSR
jgi:serine/threonine protein phosphatase PrpC